ncbi:condensation domain-containing protein [Nocardia brasiliensis]|uniref:condensation domain-containing protein n=1 Tax=Nocardia brasiliensis TaxID=37326 RepID=UPI001894ED7F|nr:condensation domain-containing protein [Nocardia brasiliensis]MBF6125121.1 thioester reductase [Nocardia brasiliensis]
MPESPVRKTSSIQPSPGSGGPARSSGARSAPLSLAQQAALLPERLRHLTAANVFRALELPAEVEMAEFERAVTSVLARHEILRTVYPADRRIPYQQVAPVPDAPVEAVRLAADELDGALLADAGHHFDLVHDIPVRIRWYALPDRTVVSIAVHPVAADDWAIELLIGELTDGREPAATPQYRDFAGAQLKGLTATAGTDPELAYWTERLAELPERAKPFAEQSAAPSAQRSVQLAPATIAALVAATPEATPTSVFTALIAAALGAAGLGDDIPVGLVDPARSAPGADTVIGNFANHLVLRLAPVREQTPRQLIAAAARRESEAKANARTRIERLAHLLSGTGAAQGHSLFPVLLRMQENSDAQARVIMRRVARPNGVDLVFEVTVDGDGATVRIDFPAVLADRREIDDFVEIFAQQARAWADGIDVAFAGLPGAPAGLALFAQAAPQQTDDYLGLPGRGGPPVTEAERHVAEAIRQILDLDDDDEVGREDTFFSLGGDSIAALRLVTVLVAQGYALEVQTVFGHPVLHELAAQLGTATTQESAGAPQAPAEVAPMSASGLDAAALSALGRKFAAK